MPLMRDWTEVVVDEDLLIPVVQELLALATDPNHVEVVYGTTGRVILADVALAETWYQGTLRRQQGTDSPDDTVAEATTSEPQPSSPDPSGTDDDSAAVSQAETSEGQETVVVASGFEVVAAANKEVVEPADIAKGTDDLVPLPVKRGPGRPRKSVPTSASNGEDE